MNYFEPAVIRKGKKVEVEITEREIELINGMIEVQKNHATRCDMISSRMSNKQKAWDFERIALLKKIKDAYDYGAVEGR